VPQRELVRNLLDARATIETWRKHYNEERPNTSQFGSTPLEYSTAAED